ncbi:MAG: hydrogenase formation protein HypD [Selenomonadaceae bacterium]|nr:hydrogenase formation protein HypD [Selenomonadaceae bacterium]
MFVLEEKKLLLEIHSLSEKLTKPVRFMEVCGTHTVSIFRHGIRQLLPKNVELVSGPGCPVCVTDDVYMDKAIAYAKRPDTIIATFGDMLKVPGSESSLEQAKTEGADIRIIYSPLDSLDIARDNPDKKVIFLAVGFETTSPTAAALTIAAKEAGISNLYLLSAQKLVPPALKTLIADKTVKVDGFILPGHVAVVTGLEPFRFLKEEHQIPAVVSGFEADEILTAITFLLNMVVNNEAKLINAYQAVVKDEGNPVARSVTEKVYEKADAAWRGMGIIPLSGLCMRDEFSSFDIEKVLPLTVKPSPKTTGCRCGDVLKGVITPFNCPLFDKTCNPENPIGPCMVSVEGVCAAYYKYGRASFSFE